MFNYYFFYRLTENSAYCNSLLNVFLIGILHPILRQERSLHNGHAHTCAGFPPSVHQYAPEAYIRRKLSLSAAIRIDSVYFYTFACISRCLSASIHHLISKMRKAQAGDPEVISIPTSKGEIENRIHLHSCVDEDILRYSILKTILQPIVVNSIMHGILEKDDQSGNITITGRIYSISE